MSWQTKWRFTGPLALGAAATKKLLARAMEQVGRHWREKFLPAKFTVRGGQKYGYARRSGDVGYPPKKGSYTWKKWRKFNHVRPLVYTGELMREALQALKGRAHATITHQGDGVIRLPVGRKANLKNPHSQAHPIRELQKLLPEEAAELSEVLVHEIDWFLHGAGEEARADFGSVAGQPTGISRAMVA